MIDSLTPFAYLSALILSCGGMLLLDWRYQLFLFKDLFRALLVLAAGIVFFVLWDIAGISAGIFLHGPAPYMTGVMLGPEFPVEELLFLAFLCHCTMVLVLGAERFLSHFKPEKKPQRTSDKATARPANEQGEGPA